MPHAYENGYLVARIPVVLINITIYLSLHFKRHTGQVRVAVVLLACIFLDFSQSLQVTESIVYLETECEGQLPDCGRFTIHDLFVTFGAI